MSLQSKKQTSIVYFFVMIFLIAASDFLYYILDSQYRIAWLKTISCFCIFLLPLFLFRNHLKIYALLLSPVFLLVPISICETLFLHYGINVTLAESIINTTQNEAVELLHQFALKVIVAFILSLIIYFLLANRIPSKISFKQSFVLSTASLMVFLALPSFHNDDVMVGSGYINKLKGNLESTFPISIGYYVKSGYQDFKLIRVTRPLRSTFRFGAKQTPLYTGKEVCVLIIGEACRADHWHINGYNRNTSPLADRRENLISFSNVASAATYTELAVPQILTLAAPEKFGDHYSQKSIISAFKEAGFTTYWIDDQFDGAQINMHKEEADNIYHFRVYREENVHLENTDMQLISALRKVLEQPVEKKFIIIHTMGSHWDYRQRYPNTYDQFKPSEKSFPVEPTDVSNRNILINTYDNCILFTDAMLDSVYQIMNTQHARSMAFFIADHGEDLMDDDNHYYLHGNFPTLFNTHVPFFIWYNDSIKNSCSEKICELIRHRDNKIGAENIFPTITNLCDIYFSGEDSTKCIDRSSFIDSKQKIIYLHNDTLNKTITFDSLKILASRTVKF